VAALCAAALGGPIDEAFELRAVFPGKLEKLAGVQVRGFLAEESLKAPAQVRAFPWIQAITSSGNPVVTKVFKHRACKGGMACPFL
jgi:hypothetical protein